ncbi:MAG: copper chaperone PCu(A)C, partial [Sphingopyxis sp.]
DWKIMKASLALFAALSLATMSLSGCKMAAEEAAPAAAQGVKVQSASARLNPNPAAPSAAYFTIIGGTGADTLTGITSPDAKRVEMHESRMEGGLMTMASVDQVEVPAGGRVVFRQGGLHVMLFDIEAAVRNGGKLHLLLIFKNGGVVPIEITVPVQPHADAVSSDAQDAPARTPTAPSAPPAHIAPAPRPPVIAAPAPTPEADHGTMEHGDHDH